MSTQPSQTPQNQPTSNAPQQTPEKALQAQMERYQMELLPKLLEVHGINPVQFTQVCINEVKRDAKMMRAFKENPASLFGAIIHAAEIGLVPSGISGEAFLIPFEVKDVNGAKRMTIKLMVGYQGMLKLIYRSGAKSVTTNLIYQEEVENGDFQYWEGTNPHIIHKPNVLKKYDNSTLVGCYAIVEMKDGSKHIKVMRKDQVQGIANTLKFENDLYFNEKKDPENWMVKKTVLKQLIKTMPKDYYSSLAVAADNKMEGNGYIVLDENGQRMVVEQAAQITAKQRSSKDIYAIAQMAEGSQERTIPLSEVVREELPEQAEIISQETVEPAKTLFNEPSKPSSAK